MPSCVSASMSENAVIIGGAFSDGVQQTTRYTEPILTVVHGIGEVRFRYINDDSRIIDPIRRLLPLRHCEEPCTSTI
jgi:hypothetical protein